VGYLTAVTPGQGNKRQWKRRVIQSLQKGEILAPIFSAERDGGTKAAEGCLGGGKRTFNRVENRLVCVAEKPRGGQW